MKAIENAFYGEEKIGYAKKAVRRKKTAASFSSAPIFANSWGLTRVKGFVTTKGLA